MRLFLDADVVLDLLTERMPHFESASRLFMSIQRGEHQGYSSAIVFVNVHYVLSRVLGRVAALNLLRKLKALITIVPTSDRAVELSLTSPFKDYEDAVQYYTALENGLEVLITRNKKDYRNVELRVLTPAEFLAGF